LLEVDPGGTTTVVVDVVNTGGVIDGITARVIGLPEQSVHAEPALLPLFPDSAGRLTLSLDVPQTQPAGRHPLTVEVVSHGARLPSQFLDLDLDVSAHPAMTFGARPRLVRARRQARFVLELANTGNLPLLVRLEATDADRAVTALFAPPEIRIEPGAVAPVLLSVRGPRMLVGAEIDRVVSVKATAQRAPRLLAGAPAEAAPPPPAPAADGPPVDITQETAVRLRQRPVISRGLLTAIILASIVALWAAIFLFGLNKVFTGDPMTKAAPASFFAATPPSGAGDGSANAAGAGTAGAAPAGALAKNGQLAPGIGGNIAGTVTAASNHKGVGRILVEALRPTKTGLQVVSSAATQSDGTYTIAGLFPSNYLVRFSAIGYPARWWPNAPSSGNAQSVAAAAQTTTAGVDLTVVGQPATVSGTVDPGDSLVPVVTTVTARSLDGVGTVPLVRTTTAANGSYTLRNLPAPGTYELSFTATGYRATTIVDSVAGGQTRLEPTVQLAVGLGQISGLVTDGANPIGGATVTTTVGGKAVTVMTPTTGSTGVFVLPNLPTPATYVITVSKDGYGTQTSVIDLPAGQSRTGETIVLAAGTGSVSGRLVDDNGQGLGGATVSVGGSVTNGGVSTTGSAGTGGSGGAPTATPSTTTLTQGQVGIFALSGLAAPGSYTLTFSLAGYAPVTVPVTLTANGAPPQVTVTMSAELGRIVGQITGSNGTNFVGATVTVTDGKQVWTTTSTGPGGALPAGGYIVAGLQPGTYAVTASAPGTRQQTALVTVVAGRDSTQSLQLVG
jgi:hypothetical protein